MKNIADKISVVSEIANKIDEPLSNVKIKLLRAKKLLAEIIQDKR